jgi:predicted Zn-dependent protease
VRRRSAHGLALALLLAALSPLAAARPEDAGSAKRRSEPDLSIPQADREVGSEEAEAVAAEIGLVEAPDLLAYVDAVGQRLAQHAPGYRFDYRFQILDDETPNAFALPGGYIFVSRGILALSNSEAELAGVLAHEIAHVASRHAAARQQVSVGGPGLLQIAQLPFLAAYSRDLERTADRAGQGLAAVAGYDPVGISDLLRNLGALERLRTGAPRIPSFLDTHPGTGERVADTATRAQAAAWTARPGVSRDRDDHLRRLDGLVVGPSAAQGVFEGARFLHAELAFTLRFPDGWELRNTPRAVGAISPDHQAQIFLEAGKPGSDPQRAAVHWAREAQSEGLRLYESAPVRIAGRDAYRLAGGVAGGGLAVTATFLPWRGRVYQLVGVSRSLDRHEAVFVNVARSFRAMTPELLARMHETRLRVVQAEAEEGLAELGRRTDNAWPLATTAALNGLLVNHRFAGGEAVKVGRQEPYRPPPQGEGPRERAGGGVRR